MILFIDVNMLRESKGVNSFKVEADFQQVSTDNGTMFSLSSIPSKEGEQVIKVEEFNLEDAVRSFVKKINP